MNIDGPTATLVGSFVAGLALLLGQVLAFVGKRGEIAATLSATMAATVTAQENALRADLYRINVDLNAQLKEALASVQGLNDKLADALHKLRASQSDNEGLLRRIAALERAHNEHNEHDEHNGRTEKGGK